MKTSLGTHITWDVYNCNADTLSFIPTVKKVLNTIVDEKGTCKMLELGKSILYKDPDQLNKSLAEFDVIV